MDSSILVKDSMSLVHYLGADSRQNCGYCSNKTMSTRGKHHHALWAELLSADDYQKLLDRGWRRSGKYCYKPINNITCCPLYTISCDALSFKPDKSQKRCIKDMNNFLNYGLIPKDNTKKSSSNDTGPRRPTLSSSASTSQFRGNSNADSDGSYITSETIQNSNLSNKHILPTNTNNKLELTRTLEYLANSSKMKSKRVLKKIHKLARVNSCTNEEAYELFRNRCRQKRERLSPKSLEDYLYPKEIPRNAHHTLELRIHSVTSDECRACRDDELNLLQRYQLSIHKDDVDTWTMKRYAGFLITSPIMESSIPTKPPASLCNRLSDHQTLLSRPQIPNNYGSYHCQYWLDGTKLIAVGVLDILSSCVTSVYLYYDPEYSFLKLGVYSALREIDMVRSLHRFNSSIANYYMGFYIHSCPKMSYKIKYQPSFLLCPETNIFVDSNTCIEKLNISNYARFATSDKEDGFKRPSLDDISRMIVMDEGSLITMGKFIDSLTKLNMSIDRLTAAVIDYSQLVGRYLAGKMILGSHTLRQEYLS